MSYPKLKIKPPKESNCQVYIRGSLLVIQPEMHVLTGESTWNPYPVEYHIQRWRFLLVFKMR